MSAQLNTRWSDKYIHNVPKFWSLAQPFQACRCFNLTGKNLFLPLTANAKSRLARGKSSCSQPQTPQIFTFSLQGTGYLPTTSTSPATKVRGQSF